MRASFLILLFYNDAHSVFKQVPEDAPLDSAKKDSYSPQCQILGEALR